MGARNAIAAFDLYAGLVPPMSLLLLVRMALMARDHDAEPWYEQGHEALARTALGRGRHAEVSRSDIAAVERAIAPLRKIGAISTARRPAPRHDGRQVVKYRLHVDAPNVPRKAWDVQSGEEAPKTTQRPTESMGRHTAERPMESVGTEPDNVPRFPEQRPTVSGATSHENRGTLYKEEEKEEKEEEKERGRAVGRAAVLLPEDTSTALARVLNHPSAELAIVTDTRPPVVEVHAGQITGAWVDHCRNNNVTLPRDLIARYGKAIKTALDDGFEPALIKRALARMLDDGQASWPGSFAAYLVRVQEGPPRTQRRMTPGEESAARLVTGADNPGEVIDAVHRFFNRGAS